VAVYDPHPNLAVSTVATPPSPATSGTSLVVQSGEGTRFGSTFSFNATVWPANSVPTPANSEVVRVSARSTDTFTITRAQESTSARTIVVGDYIAATVTSKVLTDLETNTEYAFTAWKDIPGIATLNNLVFASATGATTDLILSGNNTAAIASAGSAFTPQRLDPTAYKVTGDSRTLQIRVRAWVITNSVAPTVTFTFNLKPVATWGGGSNADPTVASLGAAVATATITTPGASSRVTADSSIVTFPADDWYVLTLTTNGTSATNSIERIGGRLQYRLLA
jgi:hypothetical protein